MNLFGVMDISGSALEAERARAEVVAANMANAETTRTPQGGPYQRQHVVFTSAAVDQPSSFAQAMLSQSGITPGAAPQVGAPNSGLQTPGVQVAAVVNDGSAPLQRYDPGHPDADKNGYVSYPNINPLSEMVDLMGAERSYGMNVSAVTASKSMISETMTILA
jgi:flagellar basal-body rod protein FlgC